MRSVCGCIPASSAATEIMNTPRRSSKPPSEPGFGRLLRRVESPASLIDSPPYLAAPRGRVAKQSLARIVIVHRRREVLERPLLLAAQVAGHLDLEAVEEIAAPAAAGPRRPLAPEPLDRA